MVLYSEAVASATMAAFYPVNALRNRALAQAKTEVRPPSNLVFTTACCAAPHVPA